VGNEKGGGRRWLIFLAFYKDCKEPARRYARIIRPNPSATDVLGAHSMPHWGGRCNSSLTFRLPAACGRLATREIVMSDGFAQWVGQRERLLINNPVNELLSQWAAVTGASPSPIITMSCSGGCNRVAALYIWLTATKPDVKRIFPTLP
jgi:hypothetical protein